MYVVGQIAVSDKKVKEDIYVFEDAFVDVQGVQTIGRRYNIQTSFLGLQTAVASLPMQSHG